MPIDSLELILAFLNHFIRLFTGLGLEGWDAKEKSESVIVTLIHHDSKRPEVHLVTIGLLLYYLWSNVVRSPTHRPLPRKLLVIESRKAEIS